jgi:FdrA protein
MLQADGVDWATAVMATPANVDALRAQGIDDGWLDQASANDLVLAAQGADDEAVAAGIDAGERALFDARPASASSDQAAPARTLREAVDRLPGANVAIISVPGPFAALEAHKAIGAGLHVLLFSDNVPVEEEVELKERAVRLGRLVMGPGAGTAVLGGCGLGFANVVRPGRVGVVAAAGTGAQEVMSLLDQWGAGVSQVIGVGGRDLSEAVGGRMAAAAVQALDEDPGTDVILLVSKPPSPEVAERVVAAAKSTPVIAALIGHDTLEGGATDALAALGLPVPDLVAGLPDAVERAAARLGPKRTLVHGLYSGGTLCYEALGLLGTVLGVPVHSNIPLDKRHGLPAPPGAHVCLDLGEEEYTRGRPHPMIDPEARLELLEEAGRRPDVAAILLDVVLGYGAHSDPAGTLAPQCAAIIEAGGPAVVAYVLGTEGDPQGLESQRRILREAGCVVAPTGARAALAAAAVARRQPALVKVLP